MKTLLAIFALSIASLANATQTVNIKPGQHVDLTLSDFHDASNSPSAPTTDNAFWCASGENYFSWQNIQVSPYLVRVTANGWGNNIGVLEHCYIHGHNSAGDWVTAGIDFQIVAGVTTSFTINVAGPFNP